jgi:hypothetical protein
MEDILNQEIKCHNFNSIEEYKSSLNETNSFNCLAVNIRSIRKHWDTLLSALNETLDKLHLLILIEINITEDELTLYNITDFNKVAHCRESRRGGGIMIFYKENLNINVMQSNFTTAETLILETTIHNSKHTVGVFYRPPATNITEFNQQLEDWLNSNEIINRKKLIMLGDLNLDTKNSARSTTISEYVEILNTKGLQLGITAGTREEIYNNNLTSTCIDHVNTRIHPNLIETIIIRTKIADHYFTGFKILSTISKEAVPKTIEIISNKITTELIKKKNWNEYLNLCDPNAIYDKLVQDFNNIYKKATIKINKQSGRISQPWFNENIKQNIQRKDMLWSQLKTSPNNSSIRAEYKTQRNHVTNLIRKEKRNYYFHKISTHTGDIKHTWNTVNEILNNKKKTLDEIITNHFKIDDTQLPDLCNKFNGSFNTKVEEMNKNRTNTEVNIELNTRKILETQICTSMLFKNLEMNTLQKIVQKLNPTASPGIDNIRPKHIKDNFEIIKKTLLHLYRQIIKTGKIPRKMKTTLLKPIYKSGPKTDPTNYRPIGAISVIMKILEYIIHNNIMEYCIKNQIFNKNQFGFIPGKSTTKLLETVTYGINTQLDKRNFVLAVLLDLTKAFDTLQHSIIIQKLKNIGIGGPLLTLFKNYLNDRQTVVRIKKTDSLPMVQKYGVIQGSPLAPLLFNIYINDIQHCNFRGQIYNYADDTILLLAHKNLTLAVKNMQHDLNLITTYFHNNFIHINTKKTKAIIFRNPKLNIDILNPINQITSHEIKCYTTNVICNCPKLQYSDSVKYLGLNFDSNMKWYSHTQNLLKKLRIIAYKCYQLKELVPTSTKRIIYFSLIESQLRYGISIYGHAPMYFLTPIIRTVNRINRIFFEGINPKTLGILSLTNLRTYTILLSFYFDNQYRNVNDNQYNTRHTRFITPQNYTEIGKQIPEYFVPAILNNLPPNLRHFDTYSQMKTEIKKYLLDTQ